MKHFIFATLLAASASAAAINICNGGTYDVTDGEYYLDATCVGSNLPKQVKIANGHNIKLTIGKVKYGYDSNPAGLTFDLGVNTRYDITFTGSTFERSLIFKNTAGSTSFAYGAPKNQLISFNQVTFTRFGQDTAFGMLDMSNANFNNARIHIANTGFMMDFHKYISTTAHGVVFPNNKDSSLVNSNVNITNSYFDVLALKATMGSRTFAKNGGDNFISAVKIGGSPTNGTTFVAHNNKFFGTNVGLSDNLNITTGIEFRDNGFGDNMTFIAYDNYFNDVSDGISVLENYGMNVTITNNVFEGHNVYQRVWVYMGAQRKSFAYVAKNQITTDAGHYAYLDIPLIRKIKSGTRWDIVENVIITGDIAYRRKPYFIYGSVEFSMEENVIVNYVDNHLDIQPGTSSANGYYMFQYDWENRMDYYPDYKYRVYFCNNTFGSVDVSTRAALDKYSLYTWDRYPVLPTASCIFKAPVAAFVSAAPAAQMTSFAVVAALVATIASLLF